MVAASAASRRADEHGALEPSHSCSLLADQLLDGRGHPRDLAATRQLCRERGRHRGGRREHAGRLPVGLGRRRSLGVAGVGPGGPGMGRVGLGTPRPAWPAVRSMAFRTTSRMYGKSGCPVLNRPSRLLGIGQVRVERHALQGQRVHPARVTRAARTVKEVAGPDQPKIDDDFAKALGLESLDKLRETVKAAA